MKICFLLIPIFLFTACNVINQDEPIPAYLHVEPFELNTTPEQGSSSSKITEVWITSGEGFLGAYTLPATFPVLEEGVTNVIFDPGIHENGIASLPNIYPFYERFELPVELKPGVVDTIRPQISYNSTAVFKLNEGFENTLHLFRDELDGNEGTVIVSAEDDVFEGNRSGKVHLDPDNPQFQAGSDRIEEFPPGGSQVYVELNYKNDFDILVGVIGYDGLGVPTTNGENFLRARDDWNKVYINLTEQINFLDNIQDIQTYQVFILSSLPLQGEAFVGEGDIYLDNIKLIHF